MYAQDREIPASAAGYASQRAGEDVVLIDGLQPRFFCVRHALGKFCLGA